MRNLLRCRRGSVAFATVIALVPLIGVVALGAEAGSWYVTKQQAQNAADAAAYSGGLRLACTLSGITTGDACDIAQDLVYRGKQFADRNRFCDPRDTSYPCANSPSTGTTQTVLIDQPTASRVRAVVGQQQPAYLAAVLGFSTIDIGATAIVEIKNPKEVCALGLGPDSNGLTIGGSSTITGNGCALMSDTAVKYNSTPNFSGSGWAVNGVNGCIGSDAHCNIGVPHNYNMLPATNPLKALDTASFNDRTGNDPPLSKMVPTTPLGCPVPLPSDIATDTNKCYEASPNSEGTGAYKDLSVSEKEWVDFLPGTYFFYNAAIKITGGTVTCRTCTSAATSGVTLVLLGDSSLSISGGTVSLSAPVTNTFSSLLNGVLIDDQAPDKSNNAVTINGGGSVSLGGTMYFPNVDVAYGGTTQNSNTACTQVIASSITINGNAYLSTENCAPGSVSKTQVVALVQ